MVDIGASSGFSAPVAPALASFKLLLKNRNQQFDVFARQAKVLKDIAYFKEKIAKVETPADIVKDRRLLMFVTSAFGLEGEEKAGGRIRKVLESDLKDPNSFANRTIDPRYKQLAEAFKFKEFGNFYVKQNLFVNDIANRYVRNEFEKSLGDKNPALREAEYFLRTIGTVQDTYQILGDKVLRSIVTTALGLPANIAVQSIEKQKALIDAKLDIKKFQTNPTSADGLAAAKPKSALDLARDELTSITDARAVVKGSQDTLTSVLDRIQDIQDEYARLANIQSGTGPYAAEIPVQQTAAPELLRQQGLLAAAQEAMGRVSANTVRMNELIQLAGNPETTADELTEYKAEFATLSAEITSAIQGADYEFDDAAAGENYTTQNLLDGSVGASISVQIKSTGETTVVRTHDLSGTFLTQIGNANTAFQAISGSSDAANINTASSNLTTAKTSGDTVKLTVDVDANLFTQGIESVSQWAGTFNTAGVYGGAEALRDAGSRIIDIDGIVAEMRTVASESALRDVGADRTDLTDKYNTLLNELQTAITTSDAGANLLNGDAGNFQIIGDSWAQARTRDFLAQLHTPLSGGGVGSQAAASALITQIDGTVATALETASREIGIDAKTFGLAADTLDPRAGVDSLYAKLSTDMEGLVEKAAVTGKNLLDTDQESIKLILGAATLNITLSAKTAFATDVADLLHTGALDLPSDALDSTAALAKLEEVRFNAARILSELNNDARKLDGAKSVTANHIKDLEEKAAANGGGPNKINATQFALKFIEKYLTLKDSENAAAGAGFSSGNAYLAQLIQPIKIRGGGLDFNT